MNVREPRGSTQRHGSSGSDTSSVVDHYKMCMKLAAENKITPKNAFSLHLIQYLPKLVQSSDLQSASLSLQASAKIFASRVDSLYQDMTNFHGRLQTVIYPKNGKEVNMSTMSEGSDTEDATAEGKKTAKQKKRKKQCYLTPKENLKLKHENRGNMPPHGNFQQITTCFDSNNLTYKMMYRIFVKNDEGELGFTYPERALYPKEETDKSDSIIRRKIVAAMKHLKTTKFSSIDLLRTTRVYPLMEPLRQALKGSSKANQGTLTPQAEAALSKSFAEVLNISLCDGGGDNREDSKDDLNDVSMLFSRLSITAHNFTQDLSGALIDADTVDVSLLPINSCLKHFDKDAQKKCSTPDVRKKQKAREKVFNTVDGEAFGHIELFKVPKPKSRLLSKKVLAKWDIAKVTFPFELDEDVEADRFEIIYSIYRNFNTRLACYFHKNLQFEDLPHEVKKEIRPDLHNEIYGKSLADAMEWYKRVKERKQRKIVAPASFIYGGRDNELFREQSEDLGSHTPGPGPDMHHSMQDSVLEQTAYDLNLSMELPFSFPACSEEIDVLSQKPTKYTLTPKEIEQMLVPQPPMVNISPIKVSKKDKNVNTEELKVMTWKLISDNKKEKLLFSDVYKQVKKTCKTKPICADSLTVHLVFVVVLILANEHDLALEGTPDLADMVIKQ